MKKPSKTILRTIRHAMETGDYLHAPEVLAWLDDEELRNSIRGFCACGHDRYAHDNSEPDINVFDPSCRECECEEYIQRVSPLK